MNISEIKGSWNESGNPSKPNSTTIWMN